MKLLFSLLLLISTFCNSQVIGYDDLRVNAITRAYLVGDSATDNADVIQRTIDAIALGGGGRFYFPNGKYITGPIIVREGVQLEGESKNNTSLILKAGSTGDLLTFLNCKNGGVENFTLDGNMLGGRNGKSSCVVIRQDPGGNSSGLLIRNNNICNAGVDGLQAYSPAWMFRVEDNDIVNCERYCIYNESTDNEFRSNNLNHGNHGGFYNSGSSTRITGGKIIGCSMYEPANGGITLSKCRRIMISQVEMQDNYYSGLVADHCTLLSITGVLSDGNAVAYRKDATKPKGYGFRFISTTDSYLQGIATNYIPTKKSQFSGGYFTDCERITMSLIETAMDNKTLMERSTNVKNYR